MDAFVKGGGGERSKMEDFVEQKQRGGREVARSGSDDDEQNEGAERKSERDE